MSQKCQNFALVSRMLALNSDSWTMRQILIFLILAIAKLSIALKCSITLDSRNVSQIVECINVKSMNDIADEIKRDWSYVRIINRASHTQFSNTAVNVPNLSAIQTLDLSKVGKLVLDDSGFTNNYDGLRNLDISGTGLEQMKASWFSRRNIEAFDISKNSLTALKKDNMKFFPFLRYFNGSYNDIKTIEAGTFLDCKKLEVMSLSHNSLVNVHIDNLPNLKALYVKSNNLNTMANSFTNMPKLEILNVADNNIASIGDRGLKTLESLKFLNISHNKLPFVYAYWFWSNDETQLSEVDLSFNAITYIDHVAFNEIPYLTFLDVSNNKIKEIFERSFQKVLNLQTLYLHNNNIEKIAPKAFEALLQLRNLDLSYNKLKTFTLDIFGGNKFTGNKIRKLNLSNNKFVTLDSTLFAILKNLVSLDLSFNEFREIKIDSLKANVNLQELLINDNEIEFLHPTFFKALVALEEVSMQNNRITFIPDTSTLRRPLKFSIGNNPLQCNCLREFIFWARTNKVKVENFKSNEENPDCVVLPETTCIKTLSEIDAYGVYDKFLDGMRLDGSDRANFFF